MASGMPKFLDARIEDCLDALGGGLEERLAAQQIAIQASSTVNG